MKLKLNLAPGEFVIIGKARVENGGNRRCTLMISGTEKILRQRRIMREADATTPAKRLYFMVQCIYLADDREALLPHYHNLAREVVQVWPQLVLAVTDVGYALLSGDYYEALNKAGVIVDLESEALSKGET